MTTPTPTVIYEDNHLLVLNKPAILATMGAEAGQPTALDWAKGYLKRKYDKPGNVYLGVVSRLDAFVTGVLPLARTSKAAQRLTRAFATREVEKCYVAITPSGWTRDSGTLTDWIRKNDRARRMEIVRPDAKGGQKAELDYEILATKGSKSLVRVNLKTGRKHQIRVQLAAAGFPILGDQKYDGGKQQAPGIGLHALRVEFAHPTLKERMTFVAPPPTHWHVWLPYLESLLGEGAN